MAQSPTELLTEMMFVADLQRSDLLQQVKEQKEEEKRNVDVTGYWRGYNEKGKGLVEYRGKTYTCTVLARKVKHYGAKVNLRRTKLGNFANW